MCKNVHIFDIGKQAGGQHSLQIGHLIIFNQIYGYLCELLCK
jgi:hypothetical protein